MRRLLYGAVAIVVAASAAFAQVKTDDHAKVMDGLRGKEDHVGAWQRYPIAGIPLVDKAPVIDGVVDAREWFASARLGRFVEYVSGVATRDRTEFYLCYTPTHLYMAFQIERPDNAKVPGPRDVLEVLFDAWHGHAKYYSVGFHLDKVLWDGVGPNVVDKAWDPAWQYKARQTESGWEGEAAVSFKDFGLDAAPAPGTIWGADFIRNEKTPVDRLAVWAFRGKNWHAVKNLGHIVFTGRAVAVRSEGVGWLDDAHQAGLKLVVANFGKEPVTLQTDLSLRKAAGPLALTFYTGIESAMAEDLPAAVGSPLRNEIERALKDYPPVKEEKKSVTVAAGGSQMIQITQADDPGDYLVTFDLTDGKAPLFAGALPFQIAVPLAIKLESYLYSAQTLAYTVDLRRVQGKITPNAALAISVKGADGKVAAEERTPGIAGRQEVTGALKMAPQPDTTLTVEARIVEGDKLITKNEEHLRVPPKPVWLGNDLGKKKFVPEPWTPVKAAANSCETTAIRYAWPKNSFLPGFTAFGREILAEPLSFTFQGVDGANLPVTVKDFKLVAKDDEKATYAFTASIADQADVKGQIDVEFDGFAWYRMTLTPRAPMDLTAATFQAVLRKEYASICTAGDNKYSGALKTEPMKFPFIFAFWIGGFEGGLQWVAESNRNWSNTKEKEAVELAATEKGGRMTIKFIDKPVKLDKPIEWSFGLMPTPARTKAKDWGKFGFFQTAGVVNPPDAPTAELQKTDPGRYHKTLVAHRYYNSEQWKKDQKVIYGFVFHGYWQEIFGYPGTYDPKLQASLKKSVQWLHGLGIKVIVYAGWGMSTSAPEWRDYGQEMIRLPLYNSGYGTYRQCPTSLWQDWFIYKVAEMIRDYDIDGIFIDSVTSPVITENYTPGMRWVDADGKVRGSYPILASREWLKRLYKLWHGEMKPTGVVYNHNSPPAVMCIENFADVRTPSEFAQTHEGAIDRAFYDYFVAKNGGEQYGLFVEFTNKDWMGAWAKKKINQLYAAALPLNVSIKSVNLYSAKRASYDLDAQPMTEIWAASLWLDRSTAEYLPWWKNADYLKTEPADEQVIHALWLQKGQKALLCVSNLKNEARQITVTLNTDKLGFKNFTVEDALTGQKLPAEGGKIVVPVEFERYRLLKLSPQ